MDEVMIQFTMSRYNERIWTYVVWHRTTVVYTCCSEVSQSNTLDLKLLLSKFISLFFIYSSNFPVNVE